MEIKKTQTATEIRDEWKPEDQHSFIGLQLGFASLQTLQNNEQRLENIEKLLKEKK